MERFGAIVMALWLSGAVLPAAENVRAAAADPDFVDGLAASTVEAVLKSTEESERVTTEKLLEAADLLSRISEEERGELYRLYRENPEQFRTALIERLRRMRADEQQRATDIRQLIVSYHAFADDAARRQMIRNVLFAAVRAEFDRKLTENRRRLDELEERLKELRREYRFREKNAAAIVEARVCKLLGEEPKAPAEDAAEKPAE